MTLARRWEVAAVVAAAVVAVAVVVAVLAFGVVRPPSLGSVEDASGPNLNAGVAWTVWSDGETCLRTARPDGEVAEPWCGPDGGELVGWDEDGVHLVRHDGGGRLLVDPVSGEVEARAGQDGDAGEPPGRPLPDTDPRPVSSLHDGRELVVSADDVELWRVEAPDTYRVHRGWRSPDGDWIAAVDSADRLLVFAADGGGPPHVWAAEADVGGPLVWQGEDPDA